MADNSLIESTPSDLFDPAPMGGANSFAPDKKNTPQLSDVIGGDYEGARAGAEAITQERMDTTERTNQQYIGRMKRDADMQRTAFEALASGPSSMPQPWDADKERAERMRTPLESFGSVGSIFGMIAAGFSRQPMMAALNAGAAAMNAIHQSDEEGYEKAYTAWKDNTNLALKRFDMQQKVFDDTQHLFNTDMNIWKAQSSANAGKFDDKIALNLLSHGMYPQYFEAMEKRANAANRMREAVEGQEIYEARRGAWKAGVADIDKALPPNAPKTGNANAMARWLLQEQMQTKAGTPGFAVYQEAIDRIKVTGKMLSGDEITKIIRDTHTRSTNKDQQVAELAVQLTKPVEEGGEGKTLAQAIVEARRRVANAEESGKVEARLPLEQFKAEHRKEIAALNNEAKSELAQKLDESKTERLFISDNFKRALAAMNIAARDEIIDKLEKGRNERLDRSEIEKMERLLVTEEGRGSRQEKHDAAVDARSQRILDNKQQDNAPMSDAAINSLVARTLAGEPTASVRRNIGYNRASNSNLNKYNDALALAMDAGGITPEDLNKRQADWLGKIAAGRTSGGAETGALKKTLDQIVPMSHALDQYERSMLRQLDILVDLGKKVDQSGVPAIERWSRPGRKALGSKDVADFDLQWNLVSTEAARAIVNPRLVGVLTDTARKEMKDALPQAANVGQLQRISARLHADADIRREEIGKEIETVKTQLQEGHIKPFTAAPGFTGRTATGPGGKRLRQTTNGDWVQ